jgi:hypothetical protein
MVKPAESPSLKRFPFRSNGDAAIRSSNARAFASA